jgi:hypothetical protein
MKGINRVESIKIYSYWQRDILTKESFENIANDIVKSSEIFGDGYLSARLIFVQKVLQCN